MGLFSKNKTKNPPFDWVELRSAEELQTAFEASGRKPVLLFKHSTRCSISSMVLRRFEKNWDSENTNCDCFYLDLIQFRAVSNAVEELTGIMHQSPQAIVLYNESVIYNASHNAISVDIIQNKLNEISKK